MPYEVVKSKMKGVEGYRVRKEGTREYFSKHPLTLEQAKKQRTAIILNEIQRGENMRLQKSPLDYSKGGIVSNPNNIKPVQGTKEDYGDIVLAMLETGEVVVPVHHSKKVIDFMRKNKLYIPNLYDD